MTETAKVQKIEIKNPATGNKYAEVLIQPVSLPDVVKLIDLAGIEKHKAQEYINRIVFEGQALA